jgi:hypothetical protein
MKRVVKKSMMAAGVLACLFASTAFAQTVTTTPEQDKATQAAALQENKDYDAAHGYKNESAKELKEEAAEKKEEAVKAEKNAAWEQDKATQAEAAKENKDFDKAHGYTNGTAAEPAAAPAVEKAAAPADESWKEAVAKDKATQEAAVEANKEYDASHGYKN